MASASRSGSSLRIESASFIGWSTIEESRKVGIEFGPFLLIDYVLEYIEARSFIGLDDRNVEIPFCIEPGRAAVRQGSCSSLA
jgi:hypothetical protein